MKTSDFDYTLPSELIAQTPAEPRDASRLLVLHRSSGKIAHTQFRELGRFLEAGDLLVLNDSRVIPARLFARETGTERRVELLLLRRVEPKVWQAIGRPGRHLRPGTRILVDASPREVELEVLEGLKDGIKVLRLSTEEGMERWGRVPLPPYIYRPLEDPERYQTVYSRPLGSAAAPTAGLHFTSGLLEELAAQGIETAYLTLHVGLDTFRPVQTGDPKQHRIYQEHLELGAEAAAKVSAARKAGRRIIAVGTTSVRTLEQIALWGEAEHGAELTPVSGWADLLILPGYQFRLVNGMITNFHLPRSTTLMLVAALAGKERLLAAYQEAIKCRYRFYSFGDGMLVL